LDFWTFSIVRYSKLLEHTTLKTTKPVILSIIHHREGPLVLFNLICGGTNLSMVSRRRPRLSSDSAMRRSCCFSSTDLGCVHSITLMSPARENSMDPSSLSLPPPPPFRNPNNDFCFAFFFASCASFFSCSSSYEGTWELWLSRRWVSRLECHLVWLRHQCFAGICCLHLQRITQTHPSEHWYPLTKLFIGLCDIP
jgi:hypothetical protein